MCINIIIINISIIISNTTITSIISSSITRPLLARDVRVPDGRRHLRGDDDTQVKNIHNNNLQQDNTTTTIQHTVKWK